MFGITALHPGSVSVKSVRLALRFYSGRVCVCLVLRFYSGRVTLKTLKIVLEAYAPGARHKLRCEGFCVCICSSCMSLNRVQSFVIDNCNGPPIENGLNNMCLQPLSRTFTFTPRVSSLAIMSFHIVLVRGRTKYCVLL